MTLQQARELAALVEAWLATTRALPGRATRLARDKAIVAVVVHGGVVVRALVGLTWADVDRDGGTLRWTTYGQPRRPSNDDAVRVALQRWREELTAALRSPPRPDDSVFPAFAPDIGDTPMPLPALQPTSLYEIVYDRLAEASVELSRISVPTVRAAVHRATPVGTPAYLATARPSPSAMVVGQRGRRIRGLRRPATNGSVRRSQEVPGPSVIAHPVSGSPPDAT